MKTKTAWAIRSLALCFLFNLAFAAVIFYMASRVIDASHQWVSALGASGAPALPANALMALGGLSALIAQTNGWLKPVLFVLASAFTLLMWFFIFLAGAGMLKVESLKVGSAAPLEVESQMIADPVEGEYPEV